MSQFDPYENCPTFQSEHFLLRKVDIADSEDLLTCYSDEETVKIVNIDRATTTEFGFDSVFQMRTCIRFWLMEYDSHHYVRFAIVDLSTKKAVGTVEISRKGDSEHLNNVGLLRLDIASSYENEAVLGELFALINSEFFDAFGLSYIITKAIQVATKRTEAVARAGYLPFYNNVIIRFTEDYYIRSKLTVEEISKSIAFCGLICALCHKSDECGGCDSTTNCCGKHLSKEGCYQYKCCKSRQIDSCASCDEMCDKDMFSDTHPPRNRAFVKFAKEYGVDYLAECVLKNQLNGIIYGWQRNYDKLESEQEVVDLLLKYK